MTPVLHRHVVLVLVDELDLSAARTIQYARTIVADEIRALHFDVDGDRTEELAAAWEQLGLARLPLDLVDCSDRRIARAAAEVAAEEVADGDTELTVLVPRRRYARGWHGLLHDKTAEAIADALAEIPHCNVTFVPYHFDARRPPSTAPGPDAGPAQPLARVGCHAIGSLPYRDHARVAGVVHALRVECAGGCPVLLCTLADETGCLTIVFLGRRRVPGIGLRARLCVEGVVGQYHGRMAMLNPAYRILGP